MARLVVRAQIAAAASGIKVFVWFGGDNPAIFETKRTVGQCRKSAAVADYQDSQPPMQPGNGLGHGAFAFGI